MEICPPLATKNVEPFVAISNIKTKKEKQEYNKKVAHVRLTFQPNDIKYLFVENENEITELIDHLDFAKSRFSPEIRRKLASRILTVEQIMNDI